MMVLNYWGIHATEQEIRSIIGGNPGDEVNIRIATPKVAEHYHLDYEVIYPSIIDWDGATIQDLKDRLNQGRPVIACIEADDKNPSDPDHALVVLGYDESKGVYFTSGTYFGNGYVFSKDEFEKRYRNEIHVLTPKKDYYKDKPITNIKLKFKVGDDWVDEPPEWVSEKFEIDVELNNQGFDAQGGWIGFESYNHSKGETTAKISVLPWASKRTDYYGETQYSYFGWYKSLIGPDKDNKAPTGMHFTTNPDFERYLYTVPHLDSKHSLNFTVRYDVTANHRDYLHILVDANLMNFNGMDYEKVELSIPIDKIEPDSTISWPEDGGIYNTSIIKTHFSADDIAGGREDSGVAYIYYKMDADSWKKISYSGGAVNIDYTLSDGRHTFYVKAEDKAGNVEEPESVTFIIDTTPPTISIISPTDGQVFTTATITVSGTVSDNIDLSKVDVKVGSGSWQTATISGTTWSKQVTLAPGLNTIYARAIDEAGNTNEISVTVTYNRPPNKPSNPSPSDGATDVSINADLSWTGGDPDGDSVTYDVYFEKGDSTPDELVSDDQTGTTYDPGTLDYGSHYYWKIVAKDEHVQSLLVMFLTSLQFLHPLQPLHHHQLLHPHHLRVQR